ncbi:hypothetical protein BaRGS_00020335, partial [Batillaria attramentaria]
SARVPSEHDVSFATAHELPRTKIRSQDLDQVNNHHMINSNDLGHVDNHNMVNSHGLPVDQTFAAREQVRGRAGWK